ncbi:MAG: 4Fe-4S binding protein [Candidatus Symbiothrix sp.]|jgi:polyferredoxin|nr:4Fe-4S binding protein [Candidatus Symbiothrix sp.]
MKHNWLNITRLALALFVFAVITWAFVDFANKAPHWVQKFPHAQIVPAILAGTIGLIVIFAVLTIAFGRIYCSILCPLGILQDILGRFLPKKRRKHHYSKPYNWLRYTLLAICAIFLIFGIATPLLALDPYSNFGRIAVNMFRPLVMEGNNGLNWLALQFNNYNFYHVTIYTVTTLSFLSALIALLIVGIMALLRGRLFCNTICPVGSLLGLLSKFSLCRVVIDTDKCTKCGLCEKACKAECIDSKAQTVDYSRCVDCFDCLDKCKKVHAINYVIAKRRSHAMTTGETDKSKRSFLLTSAAMATTLPFIQGCVKAVSKDVDPTKLTPITPPGSKSLAHFNANCTACHLCVTHCPQQILKPAGFEFGIEYAFKPHLTFYEMAFCNYNCTVCSDVCPNHAIEPFKGGLKEKQTTQIGIAQFNKNNCIVFSENTSCGACSEHCPVQAVRMEPYGDSGLTLPHVYNDLCIGCGGCESICPVRPVKAINILANAVHQTAHAPKEEEVKDVDAESLDFGF